MLSRARHSAWRGWTLAVLAAGVLSACDLATIPGPEVSPAPAPRSAPPAASQASADLARYYARLEQRQLAQGLLRKDGGGVDTPFDARDLARNFERIALYDEYTLRGGRFIAQQSESRLRRWERPIRVQPYFGDSVALAERAEVTRELTTYVERLTRVTGTNMSMANATPNFHVLFLNADEMADAGELLRDLVPGIGASTINDIATMPRYTMCSVYAFSESADPDVYVAAIAVIRAEHPPLLRSSCIHEEIAQGLGLANDSPAARPSIFNDDDEFALLTTQDELLLRMLYDPRLEPGMTPDQARPIVVRIAAELTGETS
jgi:hypothetical protein